MMHTTTILGSTTETARDEALAFALSLRDPMADEWDRVHAARRLRGGEILTRRGVSILDDKYAPLDAV